ncbi:hypothetical protein LEN26_015163 [Aphanomyces euteiches]|nr:hypothetical protein LEN26_015163 [Aphanomyces euteiches]
MLRAVAASLLASWVFSTEWKALPNDTDYIGGDLNSTLRASISDCAEDCAATRHCWLFVWSHRNGGTCFLKERTAAASHVSLPGIRAGELVQTEPPPSLFKRNDVQGNVFATTDVQVHEAGTFPLPTLVFHSMAQAMWANDLPEALVTAKISNGQELFNESLLVHHDLATPFHHVESISECARIAFAYTRVFFTYLRQSQLCILVNSTREKTSSALNLATREGHPMPAWDNSLPSIFDRASGIATSSLACSSACTADTSCAASLWNAATNNCTLFAPRKALFDDIYAGWIAPPAVMRSPDSVEPYALVRNALSSSDSLFEKQDAAGMSATDCAVRSAQQGQLFFAFDEQTQTCRIAKTQSILAHDDASATSFLYWTPTAPIKLHGALAEDVIPRRQSRHEDVAGCTSACIPSFELCFGSLWLADKKTCYIYLPNVAAANASNHSFLGWIAKTPLSLQVNDEEFPAPSPDQVHVFISAHQDDHELFMSADVMHALANPHAKLVFIYTTAGDADARDGWWEARESGTLAASSTLVELLAEPSFNSRRKTSLARVGRFHVRRTDVGDRLRHYFVRLGEESMFKFALDNATNRVEKPLGNDNHEEEDVYTSLDDVKAVVRAILRDETYGFPSVVVGANEFHGLDAADQGVDHQLHEATGAITASVLETYPLWAQCVHQKYYFGYQRWQAQANIPEPYRSFQRYMWLQLSAAIDARYSKGYPVWMDHIHVLGRQYIAREVLNTTFPCH